MNNIVLEKIMKIWYFENTHRDKSNDILYDIIYLYILVEKCDSSKLSQNYTFSNESSIAERRKCNTSILVGKLVPAHKYLLFMELSVFNTIGRKDGEGVGVGVNNLWGSVL